MCPRSLQISAKIEEGTMDCGIIRRCAFGSWCHLSPYAGFSCWSLRFFGYAGILKYTKINRTKLLK